MAIDLPQRPRRNRKSEAVRRLVRETTLTQADFIYPMFVIEGDHKRVPVDSMPDVARLSRDMIVEHAREAHQRGIPAVALFPALPDDKKDKTATESKNAAGLLQNTVRDLKSALPDLAVITDVAMDPYSIDGHDGVVQNGEILNDETLPILAEMAISQAEAGADLVAPSDMMDGRVGYLRAALDSAGHESVGILAYSAKYASAYYGPFRDALESAPKEGDKKTYQMDPPNAREAVREALLDEDEGADILMVKPAMPYLDVLKELRAATQLPLAAYQVSGEYAMIHAAGQNGWIDTNAAMFEALTAIKRAGADMILTYAAVAIAGRM